MRNTFARAPHKLAHRGVAVLEVALVLPILLLLSFGLVEYGHYFYVTHTLQGAAREGVRASIPRSATNAQVTSAIDNAMRVAGMDDTPYTVVISPTDVSTAPEGASVTVRVELEWGRVGLRPLGLIPANKLAQGMVVMRKEGI